MSDLAALTCHGRPCMADANAFPIPRGLGWWNRRADGAQWLEALPRLVLECAENWCLSVFPPYEPGTLAWVAPVDLADGTPAELKINCADANAHYEADALRWWDGNGAVSLLAEDPTRGALLIERCESGEPLSSVEREEDVCAISADILARLWSIERQHPQLPSLEEVVHQWLLEIHTNAPAVSQLCPAVLIDAATSDGLDLVASQPDVTLLHQDLHCDNVLSNGGSWLAIDPKPMIGERALDVAPILADRREALRRAAHPVSVVRRRLDFLVDLSLDRDRVARWALVQTLGRALTPPIDLEALAIAQLLADL